MCRSVTGATLMHLELPADLWFHEKGCMGMSRGLKLSYSMGVFPGVFGLAQAGMTYVGPQAEHAGLPVFPHIRPRVFSNAVVQLSNCSSVIQQAA
jgi:hypothetical protein